MPLFVANEEYKNTLKNLRELVGQKQNPLGKRKKMQELWVEFRQSQTDRDFDPKQFPDKEKIVGITLSFDDEETTIILTEMMDEDIVVYWGEIYAPLLPVESDNPYGLIWETNPTLNPPKKGSFDEQTTNPYRPIYPQDIWL